MIKKKVLVTKTEILKTLLMILLIEFILQKDGKYG